MKLQYHSASRIKALSECKHFFYRKYVIKDLLNVPENNSPYALLGKALHKTLEEWRKNPTMDKRFMINVFLNNFPLGKNHFLFKEGYSIICGLELKYIKRGKLVATEFDFETNIDGIVYKGVIDKIEKIDENKLLITDYKSNKTINPEEYIHQLAIYDMALEDKFPGLIREHELYYLRFNKSIPFNFTNKSHEKIKKMFQTIDKYVSEYHDKPEKWPKLATKENICLYCPLNNECWA